MKELLSVQQIVQLLTEMASGEEVDVSLQESGKYK
jgi:hypothetical protein